MIKLFQQLLIGEWFHYGDNPEGLRMKSDPSHYVGPMGIRKSHPHVAIFSDTLGKKPMGGLLGDKEGDPNDGRDNNP